MRAEKRVRDPIFTIRCWHRIRREETIQQWAAIINLDVCIVTRFYPPTTSCCARPAWNLTVSRQNTIRANHCNSIQIPAANYNHCCCLTRASHPEGRIPISCIFDTQHNQYHVHRTLLLSRLIYKGEELLLCYQPQLLQLAGVHQRMEEFLVFIR